MNGETISISPEHVVGACAQKKAEGCRFVTMTCVALDENTVEVLYHFDKDLRLQHLRLSVPSGSSLPSISGIYFAAFLVENEIQDLFGLRFSGLSIDYKGGLYLDEEVRAAPFCKYSVQEESQADKSLGTAGSEE